MELTKKSIIFFIFIAATISGPITCGLISLSSAISNVDTNNKTLFGTGWNNTTTGSNCCSFGILSKISTTTGNNNSSFGTEALRYNLTGTNK